MRTKPGTARRNGRAAAMRGIAWCLLAAIIAPAAAARAGEFTFDRVVEDARQLAAEPYENTGGQVPETLRALSKDQWDKIRFPDTRLLWSAEALPFTVGFYHPGFIYDRTTRVHVVDGETVGTIAFSADLFDYPNAETEAWAKAAETGFAGLFVRFNFNTENVPGAEPSDIELASFLGASYFQSRGRHADYGVYARGLAVDTALADGEEFPFFRDFWLVKPEADASSLSMYALLDSPRLTGAFHFVLTPGLSTIMAVESRFFLRGGASVPGKIGYAPLTSMFLSSEATGCLPGDYRPEVHSSDGLLSSAGENDWSWRPLANPKRLTINHFPMDNPRGFGLVQRDDNFDHYQDLRARFERRTSVWVEPVGDWGNGVIELVEIPGSEDYHSNIVAFWTPSPNAKPTAAPEPDEAPPPHASLAYNLHWMTPGVSPHSLGRVTATRVQKRAHDNTLTFYIDFEGEQLNAFSADTGLASIVEIPEQFTLVEKQLFKNEVTSGWRLALTIRLPQNGILNNLFSSRDGAEGARFTALLKQGENLPDPLTEKWIYHLQP